MFRNDQANPKPTAISLWEETKVGLILFLLSYIQQLDQHWRNKISPTFVSYKSSSSDTPKYPDLF